MTSSRSRIERRIEWEKLQGGEDWCEWDIKPWLESCLTSQTEFLSLAAGRQYEPALVIADWSALSVFRSLSYYGLYGDLLERNELGEPASYLDEQIELGRAIHEKAPFRCDDRIVSKIIAVAEARRNVERSYGSVEPMALAVLGGVSEGRIRNLMSGVGAELKSIEGRIPAPDAGRWLQGRGSFWPSIWTDEPEPEKENMMDNVRVPQASDGTVFHPGLRRRSGYMIGEKGSELTIENYDIALKTLGDMDTPRWRRPNSQGNWGIVRATGWVHLSRRDLNSMKD
jgi:hypothetical protein